MSQDQIRDLDDLAASIPDGAKLAVPADYSGPAIAATRALVRRGVKHLHLVCVPVSGLQAELLIGAGAVDIIETSAVTLGEFGPAPRFVEAVRRGKITLKDATCPAIHAALQAAVKGLPFMPLRGILGSDLLGIARIGRSSRTPSIPATASWRFPRSSPTSRCSTPRSPIARGMSSSGGIVSS